MTTPVGRRKGCRTPTGGLCVDGRAACSWSSSRHRHVVEEQRSPNRDTRHDDGEFAQPDMWCSAVLPACPRAAVVASPTTVAPVVRQATGVAQSRTPSTGEADPHEPAGVARPSRDRAVRRDGAHRHCGRAGTGTAGDGGFACAAGCRNTPAPAPVWNRVPPMLSTEAAARRSTPPVDKPHRPTPPKTQG